MKITLRFKGGTGSGHHGHSGRPGKRGGSGPGTGGASDTEISDTLSDYEVRALWDWTGDHWLDEVGVDKTQRISVGLKDALNKMPTYKGELVRYESRERNLNIGDSIELSTITSFAQSDTRLHETLGGYSKTKFSVSNGVGKRLIMSHRPTEKEIIVPGGVSFSVVGITKEQLEPYGLNRTGVEQITYHLTQNNIIHTVEN